MPVHGTTLQALAGSRTWLAYVFLNELTYLRANNALLLPPSLLFHILLGKLSLETALAIATMSTLRVAGTFPGAAHNSRRW